MLNVALDVLIIQCRFQDERRPLTLSHLEHGWWTANYVTKDGCGPLWTAKND